LDYGTLKRYLQLCGIQQPPAKSAAARLARLHFNAMSIDNEEQTIVSLANLVVVLLYQPTNASFSLSLSLIGEFCAASTSRTALTRCFVK
jgi:hypothetical protein